MSIGYPKSRLRIVANALKRSLSTIANDNKGVSNQSQSATSSCQYHQRHFGLPRCASGGTASSYITQENARSYPSLIQYMCFLVGVWVVLGTIFFSFFLLVFDYGDGVQCKDLYCESSFLTNLYFLSPIFTFWHRTTWIFCTHTIDTSCGGSVI